MGAGTSKYVRLKNVKTHSKKTVHSHENVRRKSPEIKDDSLRQVKSSCIGTAAHIGEGGVAYYTSLEDDLSLCDAPNGDPAQALCKPSRAPLKSQSDVLTDSFTAKESLCDAPIGDPVPAPCKPCRTPLKSQSDVLIDSFSAKEREIMADVLKADSTPEKGRWAKISEERILLTLRRRGRREEETKQRHLHKMREAERRRQAVQNRLRPKQSKDNTFID